MHLPIGCDNFREIIDNQLVFIDKTLFIKEILDNRGVKASIITRPRRFGKTLNLSMLQHFLSKEVNGKSTQGLFDGLKITTLGKEYMQYQGKYPVIMATFKLVFNQTYEDAYTAICHLISQLYRDHQYLLSSPQLTDFEKGRFSAILNNETDTQTISESLFDLCYYLYKHTGIKPWLLIDEYDTPLHSAYLNGYYDKMILLMRTIFGSALKTNHFLERAVITGILRISKESLFSGANNVMVYSLLDSNYSEHFGFTETEVKHLLQITNLSHYYPNIRHWYNGYRMGKLEIYNPWSLINCIYHHGDLKSYWVNTSGNDLVKHLLAHSNQQIKMDLETIIQGESITSIIDENLVFGDLQKNQNAVWSLLLFCGYLKTTHLENKDSKLQCELAVPNQEIMSLYRDVIRGWLSEPLGDQYLNFLLSLTEGKIEEFSEQLQDYLLQTLSYFDESGQQPERFYHGLVLGMMVSLRETHQVKSNRESGYGRYDVMLIPKDHQQLGIILEFKTVRDKKLDLAVAAKAALQQIAECHYAADLQQQGIKNILHLGLAFRGKEVAVMAKTSLANIDSIVTT